MAVIQQSFSLKTSRRCEMIDITSRVARVVSDSTTSGASMRPVQTRKAFRLDLLRRLARFHLGSEALGPSPDHRPCVARRVNSLP